MVNYEGVNFNSPIVQNMMQNGQLGQLQQQYSYSPYVMMGQSVEQPKPYVPDVYVGNMAQFGGYGYNQPQQNNGYTFSPVQGGYQQQQMYNQPYNYGYQQQYQPYGYQQQGYGYQQPAYGTYGGYQQPSSPFLLATPDENYKTVFHGSYMQASEYASVNKMAIDNIKSKARFCAKYFGAEVDEEQLDRRFNPNNKHNRRQVMEQYSPDYAEYQEMRSYVALIDHPWMETNAMREARLIALHEENFHKQFDGMRAYEFINDHLWRFQREWWIEENVVKGGGLNRTYNRDSFRELLGLHSNQNPYLNDLLGNEKYDSNLDDMERKMPFLLSELGKAQRIKNVLEGPVPEFISNKETQQKRHDFLNALMQMQQAKREGKV